jgi:branched-chain amino acid transport system ATP-binding protein
VDRVADIIELRDIHVNYGKIQAVRGLSFGLEEGRIIALMGSNGAGKSTILKSIIGLKELSGGEILFEGSRVSGKSTPEMVRLGVALCPEGRRIFPAMTVTKNLTVGAYLRKDEAEIKRQREEIYELFPILGERRHQRGGSLSGGEQQMLAIGRALMAGPKLLLLDEPSLGLAPLMVEQVGTIITSIMKRGMSIILAEQNALWSLALSQFGFVMENGKIVMQGSYEELVKDNYIMEAYLGG